MPTINDRWGKGWGMTQMGEPIPDDSPSNLPSGANIRIRIQDNSGNSAEAQYPIPPKIFYDPLALEDFLKSPILIGPLLNFVKREAVKWLEGGGPFVEAVKKAAFRESD